MIDDLPSFDDRSVRRAVWRGVLRTAMVAAAALTAFVLIATAASAAISAVRTDPFFRVAYFGTVVAHPEYQLSQDGSCCGAGPLLGLTNLGLRSELTLRARPLGALNFPAATTVTISQDGWGRLHGDFGGNATPLGDALRRGRPDPTHAAQFLASLPSTAAVSALVEFDRPLDGAAFQAFFDRMVPVQAVADRGTPVFAVDPYASRDTNPVSWPNANLNELRSWAHELDSGDDNRLANVGLAPSAELQRVADEGRVYAFVLPRIPLPALLALAKDPTVGSVNILDVTYDPNVQR